MDHLVDHTAEAPPVWHERVAVVTDHLWSCGGEVCDVCVCVCVCVVSAQNNDKNSKLYSIITLNCKQKINILTEDRRDAQPM